MRTSKPFATISYNSIEFLTEKLNDLVKRRSVAFYAFIKHYPEKDESKAHIHLYIQPNGLLGTDELDDYLMELDPKHPDKPLGIMPCRPSKFGDWFLYCCHDVAYLLSKGQTRQYHYQINEFHSSNDDYLLELTHFIDLSKYTRQKEIALRLDAGESLTDMIKDGVIPIQQMTAWTSFYNQTFDTVYRNQSSTHSPKSLPEPKNAGDPSPSGEKK